MQPQMLLPALAAIFVSLSGLVQATPIPCPDAKIDAILNGQLSPDACCGGGICKNDILHKY